MGFRSLRACGCTWVTGWLPGWLQRLMPTYTRSPEPFESCLGQAQQEDGLPEKDSEREREKERKNERKKERKKESCPRKPLSLSSKLGWLLWVRISSIRTIQETLQKSDPYLESYPPQSRYWPRASSLFELRSCCVEDLASALKTLEDLKAQTGSNVGGIWERTWA